MVKPFHETHVFTRWAMSCYLRGQRVRYKMKLLFQPCRPCHSAGEEMKHFVISFTWLPHDWQLTFSQRLLCCLGIYMHYIPAQSCRQAIWSRFRAVRNRRDCALLRELKSLFSIILTKITWHEIDWNWLNWIRNGGDLTGARTHFPNTIVLLPNFL